MSIRDIIEIDEELCNGCGACETGCAEGALKVIDGKARLVKEQFCDGFGDCIGECPTGALKIVEREADHFDVAAVRHNLMAMQGLAAVKRMESANARHETAQAGRQTAQTQPQAPPGPRPASPGVRQTSPASAPQPPFPPTGGCPGSRMRQFDRPTRTAPTPSNSSAPGHAIPSELSQWPVQLHLVSPGAPFFKNKELVVLSTCAPVASADVHWRFLRGRSVVVACPKLDNTAPYADKLAAILSEPSIPKITVVRMHVPCCGGLTAILAQAIAKSGRASLKAEETVVSLEGDVLDTRPLP